MKHVVFDKENFPLCKGENIESIYFDEETNDEMLNNLRNGPNEIHLRHVPANQNHRDKHNNETSTTNAKAEGTSKVFPEKL